MKTDVTPYLPVVPLLAFGFAILMLRRKVRLLESPDVAARRTGAKNPFTRLCEDLATMSGSSLTAGEFSAVWATCALLPALAGVALGMGATSLALLAAGAAAPVLWARARSRAKRRRFEEMLGETMPLIATNLRSGSSLSQSIFTVGDHMGEPLSSEFQRFRADRQAGASATEAIERMSKRIGSKDLVLFAVAVDISQRTGGSLADITDRVGETIRARTELRAFARAKTSMNKTSARIIAALPFMFALVRALTDEPTRLFYLSPAGIAVIVVAAVLDLIGYVSLCKISDIKLN